MTALHWHSIGKLASAIRRKDISARELLDIHLARIESLNDKINAVVTLNTEQARHQANLIDAATARGEFKGPLHGIPITIKDSFEAAGLKTKCGARV